MKCKKCKDLMNVFNQIENSTNRDYWLMTEMFMSLHKGKDYCRLKCKLKNCNNEVYEDLDPYYCPKHENELNDVRDTEVED